MSTPAARVFGQGTGRKRSVPIFLCCYHKVGTMLLHNIVQSLHRELGWSFRIVVGRIEAPPCDADVVVFLHSLIDLGRFALPYTGAHLIRDPRDVIVSGYHYHKRCGEQWCTNEDLQPIRPIRFPKVPFSQEYRSDEWKERYLASLGGRSYQQTLRALDQRAGLLFEMHHYAGWTIDSMLDWDYSRPNMLELRFETLMSDFDATFRRMFESFGLSEREFSQAMSIAAREDLGRMTQEQIEAMEHVSPGGATKWQAYFDDTLKDAFRQRFGDALVRLGYEASNDW